MFTECPECQTTFRLTAQILRQAQGRVRCGGCGSTFNALDNLSEEPPGQDSSDTQTARRFEEESRELLETLDELSGGEQPRVEDTGAQRQIVEGEDDSGDGTRPGGEDRDAPLPDAERADDAAAGGTAGGDAPQGDLDLGEEELRFDDNTPLPEDFYSAGSPTPRRRAGDRSDEPRPAAIPEAAQTTQVDLEFSDVDWQDLLAEVEASDAGPASGSAKSADAEAPGRTPEEPEPEPAPGEDEPQTAAAPAGADDSETPATTAADVPPVDVEEESSTEPVAAEAAAAGDEVTRPVPADDGAPLEAGSDDERTAEFVSDEREEQAAEDDDTRTEEAGVGPWYEDPSLVETIVMEGDSFSDTLSAADDETDSDDGDAEPQSGDAELPALEDGQLAAGGASKSPAMSPRQRYAGIAAIVLLGLLLAGQVVHANREALATLGLFEATLGPLYAALGSPVTPAWDIRGWQFESTSGSTDESGSRLTIFSRIANRSDGDLPYPLVHVSLTDRFDDVIGSRLLEPGEYLAGNARVSRPVAAGDDFTAVITVDAPSPDATGFKLNVCYPLAGGQVRCAIENFRD